MSGNNDQIIAAIYASVDELNCLLGNNNKLEKRLDSILLKDGAGLDSLGFVNFVSLVEQECQERFGKGLVLTQTDRDKESSDPFETIGSLVEYVDTLLRG